MSWFEKLTGFEERSTQHVKTNLRFEGTVLTSLVNGRAIHVGVFSTPSLSELRTSKLRGNIDNAAASSSRIHVEELVGDVQSLHQNPTNTNAVFQVASQFNCLEMAGPELTPEDGVTIYQNDWTQGPICAICAGGGTICRNYFVPVNGAEGQTAKNQIDCLLEIGRYFNNDNDRLWRMQNGYCFPSRGGLAEVEKLLSACHPTEWDELCGKLRVGVQSGTEVTVGNSAHRVTQVFCSALPVAYSNIFADEWNFFPRLILDGTYEATFWVALENLRKTGCAKLYLTLVGGGVFGNRLDWILSSIGRSIRKFQSTELEVFLVSYGRSSPAIRKWLDSITS